MKGKLFLVMAAGLALGLSCPAAMAESKDYTNEYFAGRTAPARTVIVKSAQVGSSGTVMVEKTISSPVMLQGAVTAPIVIEDRIVKKKHLFAVGIWPLFNFEVL